MRRWGAALLVAGTAVVVAAVDLAAGSPVTAIVLAALLLLAAVLLSPAMPPLPVDAAEARRRAQVDGRPIVYWRPGCAYCIRLRLSLGRAASGAHWVDIWQDPEGAAVVRGITGGDETVPTVVTADRSEVNPSPRWVRDRIRG